MTPLLFSLAAPAIELRFARWEMALAMLGGFAIGALFSVTFGYVYGALRERRKWKMTPPERGEWHFHDGHVLHFHVSEPDEAVDRLLAASRKR